MISKIIQKEKDRQEEALKDFTSTWNKDFHYHECDMCGEKFSCQSGIDKHFEIHRSAHIEIKQHKQSLINLKEYLEGILQPIIKDERVVQSEYDFGDGKDFHKTSNQLKEDIKELTRMIDLYK